jgi:hypothetical protein
MIVSGKSRGVGVIDVVTRDSRAQRAKQALQLLPDDRCGSNVNGECHAT